MSERIEGFWNAELIGKYEAAIDIVIGKIREIDQRVYERNGQHVLRFVEKRLKSPESIMNKLERKGKNADRDKPEDVLNDLAGVRAICFDTRQVYELVGEIRKINEFKIIKEKDYIQKPKVNGYQSYHMILKISGVKVELQIRTLLMDAWSSMETILIYKKTTPLPEYLEKDIQKFSKWSRKMDSLVEKILERKDEGL